MEIHLSKTRSFQQILSLIRKVICGSLPVKTGCMIIYPKRAPIKPGFSNELIHCCMINNLFQNILSWIRTIIYGWELITAFSFSTERPENFQCLIMVLKRNWNRSPVSDLCFDSFGNLWIGSFTRGLLKYEDKPQLKSYRHNELDKNSLTAGMGKFYLRSQ